MKSFMSDWYWLFYVLKLLPICNLNGCGGWIWIPCGRIQVWCSGIGDGWPLQVLWLSVMRRLLESKWVVCTGLGERAVVALRRLWWVTVVCGGSDYSCGGLAGVDCSRFGDTCTDHRMWEKICQVVVFFFHFLVTSTLSHPPTPPLLPRGTVYSHASVSPQGSTASNPSLLGCPLPNR